MKKITFLLLATFTFVWQSNAQCINTALYPNADVVANNDGLSNEIAGCNYAGEYSSLIGLAIGDEYEFSVRLSTDNTHGYVTVIDAADGVTVLANGVSPLNWTATVGSVQLHWNNDSTCDTDTECHYTRYTDLTNAPDPLANDECSGAIALNCNDTVTGSTTAATDSVGDSNFANDVWYSYTGSGTPEDITLSLCNSGFDTVLRVYSDCSVSLGAQVLYNDDYCLSRSEGTFASDGTTTYYILIEGYGTASGAYELTLTCGTYVPAPPNDLCANAEALSLNVTTSGSTAGATDNSTSDLDDTTCPSFSFKADVWYYFVATDSDVSIVTTITGASDQANVAVYDTNNSVVCSQLDSDLIACESGDGGESFNLTDLVADNTYYIRVWSDGVAARSSESRIEGTFTITVNDALLSTNDFENVRAFKYFPNPVSNELSLKAKSIIQYIAIYNMLGQKVLTSSPNTLESDINMNQLQSGAYFVKVTIDDTTETIRVIKQ